MGRLFWKFFAFVWLAQLAVLLTLGSIFWFASRHREQALAGGPMVDARLHAGAAVLRYAGLPAFEAWAGTEAGPPVYAVASDGSEALHRPIAGGGVEQFRDEVDGHRVLAVRSVEGNEYWLFTPERPDFERFGGPHSRGGPPGQPTLWPRTLPPPPMLLATLAGSVLTALLLAWYVARPIRSLRAAFVEAASGNLDRQVAAEIGPRKDELADLGRDFDRMIGRLKAAMQAQRQLLHDVSHELRSPLARLQAAVSILREQPGESSSLLARIERETERIDLLVGDLLRLSRLEAGDLSGQAEPVAVDDLVRPIVEGAELEAKAQNRQVQWRPGTSVVIEARRELLHRAIENIVRNALAHAPQSKVIHLDTDVDESADECVLKVMDSGPGVPPEEIPLLTRPFFRGASRTGAGHGLGLAIAHRCIEAHGGRLKIFNRPEGGLCVEVRLPLNHPRVQLA